MLVMKKCSAFILALLLLWSCGTPDEAFHNPIRVDIDERHDVSIFDIFERIEIIPLETTDESIFRFVDKLIYHEGVFYIFDFVSDKILAFDSTGKFLFKIDDRGQGPEQYLNISDFEIDRQANKLLVLDPLRSDMIEYDLSGNFLRRISLPAIMGAYQYLKCLGNDVIAFWTFDETNRLKFFDRNNNSIFQEHFPRKVRSLFDHFTVAAFPYANRVMRESVTDNRVFEVFSDGTYSVAYTWDFGRLNNPANIASRFPRSEQRHSPEERNALMNRMRNSEMVNYFFNRTGGNRTYRYAQVTRRGEWVNIFHNISEDRAIVFTETTESARFYPIFWSDEFVIGWGPFADRFLRTAPDAILDERNLEIKRNIDEFDNPTLIKYWFRR